MIPNYNRYTAKIELRLDESVRQQLEVLARFARSRSVSDYLRGAIEDFLDRERKRLGLTEPQIQTAIDLLKRERAAANIRVIHHGGRKKD